MTQICPRCRSKLYTLGVPVLSFDNVPLVQRLKCPVCGQEIDIARGILPIQYTGFIVLEKQPWDPEKDKPIPLPQAPPSNAMWQDSIMPLWQKYGLLIGVIAVLAVVFRGGIHIHRKG